MVYISRNNRLGGRRTVALCGLCGFTVRDIIRGDAHHNSQEVRLMYKRRMCDHHWLDIYRYAILIWANKPKIWIDGSVWWFTDVQHVIFVHFIESPG